MSLSPCCHSYKKLLGNGNRTDQLLTKHKKKVVVLTLLFGLAHTIAMAPVTPPTSPTAQRKTQQQTQAPVISLISAVVLTILMHMGRRQCISKQS